MLKASKIRNSNLLVIVLLVFISSFTFQSPLFAGNNIPEAEKYRELGFVEQKKGNLLEALSYYTKAVELGLESPVVLNDIAIIYEHINLYTKAETFYLQAIHLDEEYLPAYMNLAYLYQSQDQSERAFVYFKKRFEKSKINDPWGQKAKEELLKIHPEFISWIITQEAKRLDEELVIKAHEEFAKNMTRSTEHFKRGQGYAEEGKYTRALMEYEEALRLAPENPKIIEAKKDLKIKLAKEDFRRRSEHTLKMIEAGNTFSARESVKGMLATIPNE